MALPCHFFPRAIWARCGKRSAPCQQWVHPTALHKRTSKRRAAPRIATDRGLTEATGRARPYSPRSRLCDADLHGAAARRIGRGRDAVIVRGASVPRVARTRAVPLRVIERADAAGAVARPSAGGARDIVDRLCTCVGRGGPGVAPGDAPGHRLRDEHAERIDPRVDVADPSAIAGGAAARDDPDDLPGRLVDRRSARVPLARGLAHHELGQRSGEDLHVLAKELLDRRRRRRSGGRCRWR